MSNVTPIRPRMTEIDALQIRLKVLSAYLDKIDPEWRKNIRESMDQAMRG